MAAYVEGDAGAFQQLFERVAPSLRGFFLRSVGKAAVAEDLMQTTFLKVHANRGRWRAGERLRPWLFTIAGRVRIDWLRRSGRAAEEPLEEEDEAHALEGAPPDPTAGLEAAELGAQVRTALDQLSEAQRVVVHLHRFEDLSFAEIGATLGISEGAAKLRAFRAYEQLRLLLADLAPERTT